jgi:hypothetical protein
MSADNNKKPGLIRLRNHVDANYCTSLDMNYHYNKVVMSADYNKNPGLIWLRNHADSIYLTWVEMN